MVITRPAPVCCPACRSACETLWNTTYTVPLSISCTSCYWYVDFPSFLYAQRLLLPSLPEQDRALLTVRLQRRLARINGPTWKKAHPRPRMATHAQPDKGKVNS